MGLCGSSEPSGKTAPKQVRVLLLGPGGCGKSTVFKQATLLSEDGTGFTQEERRTWAIRMNSRLVQVARILASASENPSALIDSPETEAMLFGDVSFGNGRSSQSFFEVESWEACVKVQPKLRAVLGRAKEAVNGETSSLVNTLAKSAHAAVLEGSAELLLESVERYTTPDFLPTDQDILQFRYPTPDIKHATMKLPGGAGQLNMTDVGGQRRERLKWKDLGESTDFVLFVASLDDYHRTLDEDATKNRLTEALMVFKMVVAKHMKDTPVILFLNKSDLFAKALLKHQLSNYYKDFPGLSVNENDGPVEPSEHQRAFEDGIRFIRDKFKRIYEAVGGKDVSTGETSGWACQVTCAVDSNQMQKVFQAVAEIVLQQSLKQSGFIK